MERLLALSPPARKRKPLLPPPRVHAPPMSRLALPRSSGPAAAPPGTPGAQHGPQAPTPGEAATAVGPATIPETALVVCDPTPAPPPESPRTPSSSAAAATAASPTRAAVWAARQTLDAAGRQLAALVDGGMEQLARVTELATTHVTRQGQRAAVAASAAV